MRVLVWGLGYVGTVVAACFAELGHEVIGVESNIEKVKTFNNGISPVKEPGLEDLIRKGLAKGNLQAVSSGTQYVPWADVSLICVGTPSAPDGSAVLYYIQSVAADIGRGLKQSDRYHVVVLRSTIFPGTSRKLLQPLLEKHSQRRSGKDFGIAMNPEFLRESTAVDDFYAPPYTVVGQLDERSGNVVAQLYNGIEAPMYRVPLEEAELLKMVNNAFHALKIGFANEIGRLCEPLGMDSHTVMNLVCADTKLNISPTYLKPGFAFGGSCLPKDLRSIACNAHRLGMQLPILESILPSNQLQVESAHVKIHELGVRRLAILGLSFKSNTDDLRESPMITLIQKLWQDGYEISVYDPEVQIDEMLGSNREYMERQLPQARRILTRSLPEALDNCEAVIVSHNRPEFLAAVDNLPHTIPVLNLVRLDASYSKYHLTSLNEHKSEEYKEMKAMAEEVELFTSLSEHKIETKEEVMAETQQVALSAAA